jgi:hypothetical protein
MKHRLNAGKNHTARRAQITGWMLEALNIIGSLFLTLCILFFVPALPE